MFSKCRSRARFVALALVTLGALRARAEEEQRPQVVEEIEVKGRRLPRVDSLEVREVRETAARDLGEALETQSNLAKVRKGGIANDVVMRGMKRDDVNVLVDGTKVHGACPSRMDPPSFHLDYAEVDRVEVRRGPFDVTQPGGVAGSVDVRTRAARPGLAAELNGGYAESGALETSGVLSFGADRADVLGGGAFKRAQPFVSGDGRNFTLAVPATVNGQPNGARYRDTSGGQTAYDVRSGWAKAAAAPAEGHRLEVAYTRQSATDVLYPYLSMDGVADDTDRVNASYRASDIGPFARIAGQAYYTRVWHDMRDTGRCSSALAAATCLGALPRDYSMRTVARSTTFGGKVEGGLTSWAEILTGADFYVRGWNNTTTRFQRMAGTYADEASIPDVTITSVGAYGQARRELMERLHATLAARLDVARSSAAIDRSALYATYQPGADLRLSRTDVLPSGNAQVEYEVFPKATLFAGYGHGARVPDPQERYIALSGMMGKASWVGDPSLRPVRNDEIDLGAKWAAPLVLVKAEVFHAWLGDYVTLVPVTVTSGTPPSAKTYRNVSARMLGGEASARIALPASLHASLAVSYARGSNETAGTPLPEIPPLKAAAALRWDVGWLFAEAEEQWAARQDRVDPALLEAPTAAWFVTNVRLGVEWKGVKAFGGVRNAFDRYYFEHLSYQRDPFATGFKVPEPGRIWYLNGQYVF